MEDVLNWLKNNKKIAIILIVLCLLILGVGFWSKIKPSTVNDNFTNTTQTTNKVAKTTDDASQTKITVDVQGEINHPGVYHLSKNARIYDAVQAAGGATPQANLKGINQAQKLHDQSQVIVPNVADNTATTTSDSSDDSTTQTGQASHTVNLNSATAEELQNINGIGPKKAEAIVQFREDNGSFNKVEDLSKVKGIGDKTIAAIKDQLTV
ncbi:helix-hairpin-helix domain-containing protein [Bombilactobacillus thymidiniphilus]|uniref:Helix-hairpin-helix domain-containing protein n=1 Tax=Bombilactobacillus thymidiniphilus TaxID=2923363 RepID=A0ABY4PDG3_9LACO|nr:helix-hairpin-helix domain-containing protein [Bombilactobacillus thymidiniphilus]UQS83756.1 helix-hairpin-helix domain-containing protein [Bombilactobacillus thymidiniphilus]